MSFQRITELVNLLINYAWIIIGIISVGLVACMVTFGVIDTSSVSPSETFTLSLEYKKSKMQLIAWFLVFTIFVKGIMVIDSKSAFRKFLDRQIERLSKLS